MSGRLLVEVFAASAEVRTVSYVGRFPDLHRVMSLRVSAITLMILPASYFCPSEGEINHKHCRFAT